jgi:uncharacterized DUF497 family protein
MKICGSPQYPIPHGCATWGQVDGKVTAGRLLLLPISGTMPRVRYEWDNGKAAENLRKHGVDFMDAIAALEDTNRLEEIDTQFEYGEERIQVVGMTRGDVLFVIVTLRDEDTCRIISARKATRHEQDRYYAGNRETW